MLLESAFDGLDETGWRKLSRNWAWFFLFLAALNEVLRHTLTFDGWLAAKVWACALSFLFTFVQIPMLLRHGLGGEQAVEEARPPRPRLSGERQTGPALAMANHHERSDRHMRRLYFALPALLLAGAGLPPARKRPRTRRPPLPIPPPMTRAMLQGRRPRCRQGRRQRLCRSRQGARQRQQGCRQGGRRCRPQAGQGGRQGWRCCRQVWQSREAGRRRSLDTLKH
jgi:hypothetical protein